MLEFEFKESDPLKRVPFHALPMGMFKRVEKDKLIAIGYKFGASAIFFGSNQLTLGVTVMESADLPTFIHISNSKITIEEL